VQRKFSADRFSAVLFFFFFFFFFSACRSRRTSCGGGLPGNAGKTGRDPAPLSTRVPPFRSRLRGGGRVFLGTAGGRRSTESVRRRRGTSRSYFDLEALMRRDLFAHPGARDLRRRPRPTAISGFSRRFAKPVEGTRRDRTTSSITSFADFDSRRQPVAPSPATSSAAGSPLTCSAAQANAGAKRVRL